MGVDIMAEEERFRNLKMDSQATSLHTETLSSVIKQHNTSEPGQAHDSSQPSLQSAVVQRSSARPGRRSLLRLVSTSIYFYFFSQCNISQYEVKFCLALGSTTGAPGKENLLASGLDDLRGLFQP